VWALGNLGMNLKRFDGIPDAEQEAALALLEQEAAAGNGERASWAKGALDALRDRAAGQGGSLGDDYLQLADADDPFLRELFALSLNFWEGKADAKERIEDVLDRLSYDAGKGEEMLAQLADEKDEPTRSVSHYPGLKVRYNAAVALARRGSPRVRLSLLKDMLDESTQMENFRRVQKDGTEVADEAAALQTLITGLQTVVELHRRNPQYDLSELRPLVDKLADAGNAAVRTEAKSTQLALEQ